MLGKRGISSSTLKIIAMISMLIDHIAYILIAPAVRVNGPDSSIYTLYCAMRGVGRIAFPIYCFLLTEGFFRTHDRKKYAFRLLLFALISEIPYDLAFYHSIRYSGHSNVFFTLLLGVVMMSLMEKAQNHFRDYRIVIMIYLAAIAACGICAEWIHCEYGIKGIIAIALLYLFRMSKEEQMIAGCVAFCWEPAALFAFPFIALYNGERGSNLKYFFYAFYPVHILFLHFLCYLIYWGKPALLSGILIKI